MSLLRTVGVQIGQDSTATNNFTLYQPAVPDGTLRLGNGNSGSVTDAITLNSSGNVGIGTSSPSQKLDVVGGAVYVGQADLSKGMYLSSVGSIELFRNDSVPYIDFKTSNSEDYDCRIQQQSDGLTFYTGGYGSTAARVVVDSSGRVTMPYQPMAMINSNVTYNLPASTTEVVWTNVSVNTGSHYSTSTGRFTAPVAGKYLVTASFHGPSSSGSRGYIARNGTQIKGWAGSVDADWGNFGTQVIADLSAGDYISVYIWAGNYVHGDPAWGGWSIQLIG